MDNGLGPLAGFLTLIASSWTIFLSFYILFSAIISRISFFIGRMISFSYSLGKYLELSDNLTFIFEALEGSAI
jgi:hypothetical protein